MTTQQQIIAFCVIGVVAVPLGTFTTIKLIKRLTRPPVNTIVRSGDIELVDVVQPTRPQQTYNQFDLLNAEYPSFPRTSNYSHYYDRVPTFYSGNPPSYRTGTLPSYQSVDRFYINSCLENSINLDYIL